MAVNIDEVIIRGVTPGNRQRILQEVQAELSRLLADQGRSPRPGGSPGPGGTSAGPRKTGGDSVAHQIAWGIYQNLPGDR